MTEMQPSMRIFSFSSRSAGFDSGDHTDSTSVLFDLEIKTKVMGIFIQTNRGLGYITLVVQYVLQCGSATPQTTLREGLRIRPRFEPGTGGPEAGTLTTRPTHQLINKFSDLKRNREPSHLYR